MAPGASARPPTILPGCTHRGRPGLGTADSSHNGSSQEPQQQDAGGRASQAGQRALRAAIRRGDPRPHSGPGACPASRRSGFRGQSCRLASPHRGPPPSARTPPGREPGGPSVRTAAGPGRWRASRCAWSSQSKAAVRTGGRTALPTAQTHVRLLKAPQRLFPSCCLAGHFQGSLP